MKLLKWLFGENKAAGCAKIDYSKQDAEDKANRDAEKLRTKLEWIERNDLQKKLDACYLGTRKKAFYGTYEEYQASYSTSAGLAGLAGLSSLAAQQQMAGLYGNGIYGKQRSSQRSFCDGIFG